MSIKIFYHIACIGPWEQIVRDQINKIIYSGLYDELESLHCYVLGHNNVDEFNKCINLLKSIGNKIVITKTNLNDKLDEAFTLLDIRNHIDNNTKFLYFHTKGVTRYNSDIYTLNKTDFKIPNLYNNVVDWRNIMEYVLIKNYKVCLQELDSSDVVGINYLIFPNNNHFSGNFWWCRGSHYLSLFIPNEGETIVCENYVCKNNPKVKQMFNSGLAGYGHYFKNYDMKNYTDTSINKIEFLNSLTHSAI